MASRTYYPPAGSLDRGVVTLFGSFLSAGASITSQDTNGFTVTQTGTGAYTITLQDAYPVSPANYVAAGATTSPLLDIGFSQEDTGNTQALSLVILDSTLIPTTGVMTVVLNSAANTPANPTSGTRIRLSIFLKNSTTPRKGS